MAKQHLAFPWGVTVFVIVSLAILLSLGTWQVKRLAWKTDILQQLDAAYASADQVEPLSSDWSLYQDQDYFYTRAEGVLLFDKALLLSPRVYKGQVGDSYIVPMRLQDGGVVFINLGWTNKDLSELSFAAETVTISGLMRRPDWNRFTPENMPDQGLWYRADLPQIAQHFALNSPATYLLYADAIDGVALDGFPLNDKWYPNNNHFYYAGFWYSMAVVLLVIYCLWLRRRG